MPGKIIQISTLTTKDGTIVLYALNDQGKVYEKLVGVQGSGWTLII